MKLQEYIKKNGVEGYVDLLETIYEKTRLVEIHRDELQELIKGMLLLVRFYNTAKKKDLSDVDFRESFKNEVNPFFEGD